MAKDKKSSQLPSGFVTFMFTDIVGSTAMKDKMDGELSSEREKAFLDLIKQPHAVMIAERVASRGGCVVQDTGDGFFIAFSDVEKAVLCAVEIQEKLRSTPIKTPDGRLQIRIGINTGHATPKNGAYTAAAVDKASRVEREGLPGEVYLSRETNELVRNKVRNISTQSTGIHFMKGVGNEELFVAFRAGSRVLNQGKLERRLSSTDEIAQTSDSSPGDLPRDEPDPFIVQQPDLVVIGDPNEERFNWLRKLLRDVYEVGAVQAKSFEQVKKFVEDKSVELTDTIVFMSDNLPFSTSKSTPDPNLNFVRLEEIASYSDFVCIVTKEQDPNLTGVNRRPHHVHLRSIPPTEKDRQTVLAELGGLGDRMARLMDLSEIARITEWDKTNRALYRQIRSLDTKHELAEGEDTLLRLIRKCINCRSASKIEIKRLGQGKSDACVFRLSITSGDRTKEYVLKLCDALWKLQNEVAGHLDAQKTTHLPEYKQHVAALRKPVNSIRSLDPSDHFKDQFIVNTGRWYAIHCDFLGGPTFGKFMDIEMALTAGPHILQEETKEALPGYRLASTDSVKVMPLRLKIFNAILDGLCEIWYGRKGFVSRTRQTVWQIEDADDERVVTLPPYQLTRRAKGLVQDFLDSPDAVIGPRLFPQWKEHVEKVLMLVSHTSTTADLGWLGSALPFTLSPVHGDLNANNVLLWLEHENYPFLVDLPSYQKDGHCLQDFARLEVEVILALLDCQEESPVDQLAAYDRSASQVPLWIEMEGRLLASWALDKSKLGKVRAPRVNWKAQGYSNNVELCYRLVTLLRQKACEMQQKRLEKGPGAVPFADEYLPALLYQSVRAIGYPSLPVLKRLLAVHTAGLILNRLRV